MAYFPQSSINILETSIPGELMYKSSKKPYIGVYIATDSNQFFAGSDYINLGPELIKPIVSILPFGDSKNVRKFNLLQSPLQNKRKTYNSITPTKVIPTEKDYIKGYYIRHFTHKVNDTSQIFEIDSKTYNNINKHKGHDKFLYKTFQISWSLEGNVRMSNKHTLDVTEKFAPHIKSLFILLNEFESLNNTHKLSTIGGELYYISGREYTGIYHMHEGKPMSGDSHNEKSIDLIYSKNLQTPNEKTGMKDFNQDSFVKSQYN